MIFESLDRMKRTAVMTTIILMIAGNMLLVLPDNILPRCNEIAGFALLVYAVLSVFNFLSSKKALIHYIHLTLGLICGMLGVFFFVFEGLLTVLLIWMVGLIPIIFGLYGIYHALVFARRSGRKGWSILIVMSLALIIFGGFAFIHPWVTSTAGHLRIVGGTLMYSAVISALRLIWLWPIQNPEGGQNA